MSWTTQSTTEITINEYPVIHSMITYIIEKQTCHGSKIRTTKLSACSSETKWSVFWQNCCMLRYKNINCNTNASSRKKRQQYCNLLHCLLHVPCLVFRFNMNWTLKRSTSTPTCTSKIGAPTLLQSISQSTATLERWSPNIQWSEQSLWTWADNERNVLYRVKPIQIWRRMRWIRPCYVRISIHFFAMKILHRWKRSESEILLILNCGYKWTDI